MRGIAIYTRAWRVGLTTLALLGMVGAARASGTAFVFVDPRNGDDSHSGLLRSPFKTVNHALEVSFCLRFPSSSGCASNPNFPAAPYDDVVIKVSAVSTPVAPDQFGGVETFGWQKPGESATHPAFPLRLIEHVSLEGILGASGQKPKVLIDELHHTTYPVSNWEGGPPKRAFIIGADGAHVTNLEFDGTVYVNKLRDQICAVYDDAPTPAGQSTFNISDCTVNDLYNGFFYVAASGTLTTGTVTGCHLTGMGYLFSGTGQPPQDQGHAGMWIVGPGTLNLSVSDTTFQGCHDGLEVAQDGVTGRLVLTNCTFDHNENGLELAAASTMSVDASTCHFLGNQNQWDIVHSIGMNPNPNPADGTPLSPGAVFVRGSFNDVIVRSSDFFNNAFGVVLQAGGVYDFGETGSFEPGMNTFSYDFSEWTNPGLPDPIRVALYLKAIDPLAAVPANYPPTVLAGGNTWYHVPQGSGFDQGTTSTGCLINPVTGPITGPQNLKLSPFGGATSHLFPPGPQVGFTDPSTMQPWDRNYSIDAYTSPIDGSHLRIDFGTDCVP